MDLNNIALEIRNLLDERRKKIKLTFSEEKHIYEMVDKDGKLRTNFPSVSKIIKKFYEEFPAEEIALKKANGNKTEAQKLLKEWAEAGEYSTNLGSRVHYYLEQKLVEKNGNYKEVRQPIFDCNDEQIRKSESMINAGYEFLELMEQRGAVLLDTEAVLGDFNLGYTGAPDKVWIMKTKSQNDFGLVITDYKTNKPKNFEVSRFTKKMKYPFHDLDDTALGHYYLQLPLYGKLILKMLEGTKFENIKLLGCVVVLLKEDSNFVEYKVPKEVINSILELNIKDFIS